VSDSRLDARIASIRRFNRFYTKQIGVLNEGLLDTELSLGEARVMYELAHSSGGASATVVGAALGIDPGYLSRMLRSLERRALIQRRPSPADRRRSTLTLTRKGRSAFARLDASARDEIASLIAGCSAREQRTLVESMAEIERILGPAEPTPRHVELRAPRPGDMGWVIERHGELYSTEYGWGTHFEALVAEIVAKFLHHHDESRERAWIADVDGERAGSIFLVRESDAVARLRLLLVEPSARGLGVGRRLVDECLSFARASGYTKVTLWTNAVLHAARTIYISTGFRLVREEAHTHFGSEQLGQDWELDL
jgi:DNA-binding MarR family transcriptional regulator/GNAT superfamily N-acetyltransferase